MYTRIKTESEIKSMRKSGKILSEVRNLLANYITPGITTKDIAKKAEKELKKLGGKPAFLGYGSPVPFPDVVCVSVNDEVVHGIPSDRKLKNGDLVSLDLGVSVNGMITDSAVTVLCGKALKPEHDQLLLNTKKSLEKGLSVVKAGCHVGDISSAVQSALDKNGYGIVRDLVGHGVGHDVHEEPNIPNFGVKSTGPKLLEGMTIAIEPMATSGNYGVHIADDGWTVKTNDGSLAVHFEHTVLITKNGCEVLTR